MQYNSYNYSKCDIMNAMREDNKNLLNTDDINIWLEEYKKTEDKKKKDQIKNFIVIACMPLVKKISHGLARRNTDPIEDIIQVGSLGLIKAIDFFDFNIGKNFKAYATYLITGEIRHYLRDKVEMIKAPREIQELAYRVNQIAIELSQKMGEKPSDELLAEILQMPVKKVNQVFEMERRKQTVSLDQLISFSDDDKQSLSERISDDDYKNSPDFQETKIMIKSALDRLPVQYQQVIEMNYYDDLSQREISERLGVSQMQVSRILKKAITELFEIVKDSNEDTRVAN